jgi:hypothetical protein
VAAVGEFAENASLGRDVKEDRAIPAAAGVIIHMATDCTDDTEGRFRIISFEYNGLVSFPLCGYVVGVTQVAYNVDARFDDNPRQILHRWCVCI